MGYIETEENIVAQATADGIASIDVIRISGPSLKGVYKKLTLEDLAPKPNYINKKYIYSPKNRQRIDVCMVSYFKNPKSFTGQDVIEISCHGGGLIGKKIIESLIQSNYARIALPGEFLFRAYMNNKIDLIQAESINQLILSDSLEEHSRNLENVDGKLSKKIKGIKADLLRLLTIIEHELDFDESEIMHIKNNEIKRIMLASKKELEDVLQCFYFSKSIKGGLRVLLFGKPNVGKSAIYNSLLGVNKSIVSESPGTTRDVVESILNINDKKVVLIDSAGSREARDKVERLGIKKTHSEVNRADIIILVGENKEDLERFYPMTKDKVCIKVISKIDINPKIKEFICCSSINDAGFNQLLTEISTKVKEHYEKNNTSNKYIINSRQKEVIRKCIDSINNTIFALESLEERDIIANLLHSLLGHFSDIVNPFDKEDIINNIFAGFCVGK